mgnify:CR=1 FL=1
MNTLKTVFIVLVFFVISKLAIAESPIRYLEGQLSHLSASSLTLSGIDYRIDQQALMIDVNGQPVTTPSALNLGPARVFVNENDHVVRVVRISANNIGKRE